MNVREKLTAISNRLMSQKKHSKYQRMQLDTYIPWLRRAALALEQEQMSNYMRRELEEKLEEGILGRPPEHHISPTWSMCCTEMRDFLATIPWREENDNIVDEEVVE
tara:strand:+ start:591 stop:911 length:321 start_codon:yes stop_codon:yes gene_type:complete